jgi:hypothetical protein
LKLYIDMDGVLADFDRAASGLLGMDSYKFEFMYGATEFWRRINQRPDFFFKLAPLPGALDMWAVLAPLNPTILTACPKRENTEKVANQKRLWIAKHLGEHVPVLTTITGKHGYAEPGAILIDDRAGEYREKWQAAGGSFIHHLSPAMTIAALGLLRARAA